MGYVDYDKEVPENIKIVPSEDLMDAYRMDYDEMCGSFIYGAALKFDALLERMKELEKRFRAAPLSEKKQVAMEEHTDL